jgi:hypothetical protein
MAMTYGLLKSKIQTEGKLTRDELFWMIDQMEKMEMEMKKLNEGLDERLRRMEMEKDDHIAGGL